MKGAWDAVAAKHNDKGKVVIADVDCTVHRDLCGTHEVRGYPTIKYFMAGNKVGEAYRGGRDEAAINSHVEETLGGTYE